MGVEFRFNSHTSIGGWTTNAIKEIRADAAVIGTSGFCGRQGPCVENRLDLEIKKAMIQSSNRIIVVGNSSKAFTNALIQYCEWGDVDALITDEWAA